MGLKLTHYRQIDDIDAVAYTDLWASCGEPAFYHPALLLAAQQHPLLGTNGVHYLAAWDEEQLKALLVVYQQQNPDPFGTLGKTTGINFDGRGGLLGHIAHCYDSRLLLRPGNNSAATVLLESLRALAAELQIPNCGLINVGDPASLTAAERAGYAVKYMHDRYIIDLTYYRTFDDYVGKLPRHGRQEMKRQLRKFNTEGGRALILRADETDLAAAAKLCHVTSARNGTPHYYPEEAFTRFLGMCGDLISVISVQVDGHQVAAVICLREPCRLHLWAGGVVYTHSDFSPYTVMIAAGIQHAFVQRIPLIEAGRTNARIKARLGCRPKPLYSVLHNDACSTKGDRSHATDTM